MFGFTRTDTSLPGVLLELSSVDAIVFNSRVLLAKQCFMSCNKTVQ